MGNGKPFWTSHRSDRLTLFALAGCSVCEPQKEQPQLVPFSALTPDRHLRLNELKREGRSLTEAEISEFLNPYYKQDKTTVYRQKDALAHLLPDYSNLPISEWVTPEAMENGFPEILFVVFSNQAKSNIVDMILVKEGFATPAIDGIMSKNLWSIKAGDSVNQVYKMIGKPNCQTYEFDGTQGAVSWTCLDERGNFIVIRVNAGTGVVEQVSRGYL